jgi:hypothetical protein
MKKIQRGRGQRQKGIQRKRKTERLGDRMAEIERKQKEIYRDKEAENKETE